MGEIITLYEHQDKGVSDIRLEFKKGFGWVLYVLPTGGGKTVVFCHIAGEAVKKGSIVWILVHRIELLRQTHRALKKSGVHAGLINPNYTPDFNARVQVASVQTIAKRMDKLPKPDLIIVDEAHHAVAGSWKKVTDANPQALGLGVTATPERSDGKSLDKKYGGVFDVMVLGPQIPELIEKGFLVKPIVYAPEERIDFSYIKLLSNGDYDPSEVVAVMDKPKITGDAVAHYRKICSGTPAVAFCVSGAHAEQVAEEFRAAGFRAFSVDGSMDDDTRKRILDGLGNGEVDIVTSCDLISEGTDIPAIGCAIFLRPTNSLSLYIQQGGRALRKLEGKKYAIILDHVGNIFRHGPLDSVRDWSLEGRKKKASKKKEETESYLRVVQCGGCFAVHEPAPLCPFCGFKNPVKDTTPDVIDGVLKAISEEEMEMFKKSKRRKIAQAKTLEELEEVGRELGHSPGWAKHLYNARNAKLL